MTSTGVEARDFSFWYGEKQALQKINLSISDK
jgi:ABC-type phosphate transport system ATPase subunit